MTAITAIVDGAKPFFKRVTDYSIRLQPEAQLPPVTSVVPLRPPLTLFEGLSLTR
jgi:hypothetical protein